MYLALFGIKQKLDLPEVQCSKSITSHFSSHYPIVREGSTSTKLSGVFKVSSPTTSGELLLPKLKVDLAALLLLWSQAVSSNIDRST